MTEIKIEGLESSEAVQQLYGALKSAGLKIEIETEDLPKILSIVEATISSDDYFKSETRVPRMPFGTLGMLVPQTYLHINLKNATLQLIVSALDFIGGTCGLASKGLELFIKASPVFSKLDPVEGEFCIYKHTLAARFEGGTQEVGALVSQLSGSDCVFPNERCRFRDSSGLCGLENRDAYFIADKLTEKAAVIRSGDELRTTV